MKTNLLLQSNYTDFNIKSVLNLSELKNLDLLMSNKKITADWLAGIIDGDGSFGIILQRRKTLSVSFEIKITQHWHSADVLFKIKDFLGCGSVVIDNRKEESLKFHVTNFEEIKQYVIPFLDKHQLLTSKRLDYLDFKKAVEIVDNKTHLTQEGENLLISIKKLINNNRPFTQRIEFSKIIAASVVPSPDWIMGFIDAKGHFYFGITLQKPIGSINKKTLLLQPYFDISQDIRDFYILELFQKYFKVGYLKLAGKKISFDFDPITSKPGVAQFIIKNEKNLKILLDFLAKHDKKFITSKVLDYMDWLKLINMKKNKNHLTTEGLSLMKNIKSNMNRGRNTYFIADPRSEESIKNLLSSNNKH